jgi:AbrB family looped-hinge helix DNA binding protein
MVDMEREVKILTILRKPQGRGFMVTIPKEIAEELNLKGGEKVKVSIDQKKRIIYQILYT